MKKNYHVVPHTDGWAVKKEGASRASSIHSIQQNAIDHGQTYAKSSNAELLIHGRNGQIRERNSYGNDPFPPKG